MVFEISYFYGLSRQSLFLTHAITAILKIGGGVGVEMVFEISYFYGLSRQFLFLTHAITAILKIGGRGRGRIKKPYGILKNIFFSHLNPVLNSSYSNFNYVSNDLKTFIDDLINFPKLWPVFCSYICFVETENVEIEKEKFLSNFFFFNDFCSGIQLKEREGSIRIALMAFVQRLAKTNFYFILKMKRSCSCKTNNHQTESC